MTDGAVVVISKHARRQLEKRGLSEIDIAEALDKGEMIFSERNSRFGIKHHSKADFPNNKLVVVWFWNKKQEKEVVTVFWRKKKG